MNADPRAPQPNASGSALEQWNDHASDLFRAARALAAAGETFSRLGRTDLAIRSTKLRWRAEGLLRELAERADAESRRLP